VNFTPSFFSSRKYKKKNQPSVHTHSTLLPFTKISFFSKSHNKSLCFKAVIDGYSELALNTAGRTDFLQNAGEGESKCSNSRALFQTPLQYHGHQVPESDRAFEVSADENFWKHGFLLLFLLLLLSVEPFRRSPVLSFRPIDKSLISSGLFFLHAAWSWRLYCRPLQMSYCCHTLLLSNRSDGFCYYTLNQPSSSAPDLQDIIVFAGGCKNRTAYTWIIKDHKKNSVKANPNLRLHSFF